ncbi:MAG: hypothetical protein CMF62_02280 [Magnetococcales bacterium]|nr:hypothetical protein [Magnetococcales bacterium]
MFRQGKQKPRKFNPTFFDKEHRPERKIPEDIKLQAFSLVQEGDYHQLKTFMLENNTNLNFTNELGESLIHAIINSPNESLSEQNRLKMIQFLIKNGSSVGALNKNN